MEFTKNLVRDVWCFIDADCPQVQAIYDYEAKQPDELDLQRGDVVKVFRKMADGKQNSHI